ncbi:hypothetical protein HYV50_02010 [Candidatus Pacearchaeota archaeon]|nr:hypothetical protein [Candidatus Pacearchaeota archaeon]
MVGKEISRKEIEEKINKMGDYAQMGYLSACLKNQLDFDTRKFVLVKLAGLYENRMMFLDAGKMMKSAADINTTYQNKINDFVKSAEFFIKGGDYENADSSIKRALALGNEKQKQEIKNKEKEVYKMQAKMFMKKDKRTNSVEVYEKLLELELGAVEKTEVKNSLLNLYEKLGRIREYYSLKKGI